MDNIMELEKKDKLSRSVCNRCGEKASGPNKRIIAVYIQQFKTGYEAHDYYYISSLNNLCYFKHCHSTTRRRYKQLLHLNSKLRGNIQLLPEFPKPTLFKPDAKTLERRFQRIKLYFTFLEKHMCTDEFAPWMTEVASFLEDPNYGKK